MPSHFVSLLAALCVVLIAAPVHGWWCNGHMLVATIAQRHLKPGVSEQMEKITARLSANGPFPKIPDFVQLACWADDIKAEKMSAMGGWHYIDTPYNPENVTIAKWPVEDKNVLTVIEDMVTVLKKGEASPYTVEFAVANLVHFYGDIHMPLHNMEFFSPEYPTGDMGGNKIVVFMGENEMNLHALWDSMCQGPQEDPPRPLSVEDYAKVSKFADYLEEHYQFTDAQKAEMDPAVFSRESYEIGVMATYNGVVNGTAVSDGYITRCRWITEARVALAGYRLATVLNSLFG